jgi:hypothetical protein
MRRDLSEIDSIALMCMDWGASAGFSAKHKTERLALPCGGDVDCLSLNGIIVEVASRNDYNIEKAGTA